MWLEELSLEGYRNLTEQSVRFSESANIIFGHNGAGKTNLLEAIAVLARGISFRTIQDSEILKFGATHFRVAGSALNERAQVWSARVYFSPAERKHYFLERREIARRSLYSGWLPVSILLLDDRRLVSGSPADRRSFLDESLSKLSRTYGFLLSEFRKVLLHRNALLKKQAGNNEFKVWEARLSELAREIATRRKEYWKRFLHHFGRMAKRFLPHSELKLEYKSNVSDEEDYRELLEQSREYEKKQGFTLRGPHRDDFRVLLESRSLRSFGSYGQQRLAALALALAETETAISAGITPVYLMDDVAAELDDHNTRLLFDLVKSKGQLFYAAANPPLNVEGKRFNVKQGSIRQV
ncbi:DNA replication and repair protein RecF [bacterium]|nr:DNA replication and repair protein RecF [bacterium]